MLTPSELAIRHLALRMQPLARVLQRAVGRQAQLAGKLLRPDATPLCVTDEQVTQLLSEIQGSVQVEPSADEWVLSDAERVAEHELRAAAESLNTRLPLELLRERADLREHEMRMLLVCVAPEIDRAYERIYAYVLDDLNRRYACVELLTQLCANHWLMRMKLHSLIGANSRLRRLGLVKCHGEAPTTLRQQLQCSPALVEFLLGSNAAFVESLRDPEEVRWPGLQVLPPGETRSRLERIADRMRQGGLDCISIWGAPRPGTSCRPAVVREENRSRLAPLSAGRLHADDNARRARGCDRALRGSKRRALARSRGFGGAVAGGVARRHGHGSE
ncbi:hypothetical protein [Bradyrhizobium sp. AZCC 1610]|uniref:hypothetical protein n=1 Tax=Bradyrhizobium sp. AZCC 1610 TaxID=3117020 RepID=UPI002FF0F6F7